MPNPTIALVGSSVGGAVIQAGAAKKAAGAQVQAAEMGIEEQRRQFDAVTALLQPYVQTGTDALSQQAALIGVGGPDVQRAAIAALEAGPEFAALTRQGEEAILQSAAATGGLRGGNVQAALAQFRPQVLSSLIGQQYERLGGLSSVGQASAARQAASAESLGANVSSLMQQVGAARAGGALASGRAFGNLFGDVGTMIGRGMAYEGYTPPGASGPLSFSQAAFGNFNFGKGM
jgi:hypothetical protein